MYCLDLEGGGRFLMLDCEMFASTGIEGEKPSRQR